MYEQHPNPPEIENNELLGRLEANPIDFGVGGNLNNVPEEINTTDGVRNLVLIGEIPEGRQNPSMRLDMSALFRLENGEIQYDVIDESGNPDTRVITAAVHAITQELQNMVAKMPTDIQLLDMRRQRSLENIESSPEDAGNIARRTSEGYTKNLDNLSISLERITDLLGVVELILEIIDKTQNLPEQIDPQITEKTKSELKRVAQRIKGDESLLSDMERSRNIMQGVVKNQLPSDEDHPIPENLLLDYEKLMLLSMKMVAELAQDYVALQIDRRGAPLRGYYLNADPNSEPTPSPDES